MPSRLLNYKLQITKLQIGLTLSPDNQSPFGFRLRIFLACVERPGLVRLGCVRSRSILILTMTGAARTSPAALHRARPASLLVYQPDHWRRQWRCGALRW